MRTNLIQTYTNNLPPFLPDKDAKNLDIKYELSNRTFIKPLPGKGHLVNTGILDAPAVVASNFTYDLKSLKKSAHGEANDHELGKVNDIGMKLGGLAIAAYLITRKQTPLTKAMEIVGLASFFSAMAIWPKIALQFPAKVLHGFNIRQKYEDSYGRKKLFFQDPQYLPFDLMDDKKINKIGNYMNVPKDIPNRREFIQEKMKKVTVQNNTMWMLTAGFATPVMSALICNASEKPLNKFLDNRRNKTSEKIIANFSNEYKRHINSDFYDKIETLYNLNKDRPLTPKLLDQIKGYLTEGLDEVTASALKQDLDSVLKVTKNNLVIDKDIVKNVIDNCSKLLEKADVAPEHISAVLPDVDTFADLLKTNKLMGKKLSEAEFNNVIQLIGNKIKANIKVHNVSNPSNVITDSRFILNTIFNQKLNKGAITSTLAQNSVRNFDSNVMANIKNISNILKDFKAKCAALNKYIYLKLAQAPETNVANSWNDVVGSLLDTFKISPKEIADTRYDSKLMTKLFRSKMEAIVSDSADYEKAITNLSNKIAQLDIKIKNIDVSKSANDGFVSILDSVFTDTASDIKNAFPRTAERLVGIFDKDPSKIIESKGSLKNTYIQYINNRLLGVKSSLYRIINTLDTYKRIATLENVPVLNQHLPREVKEELVEMVKKMGIEGKVSDFLTKFYELRNPNPNLEDFSQIEVKAGKVINKYLDAAKSGKKVDLSNDKSFFKNVISFLFEGDLHKETKKIIDPTILSKELLEYRQKSAHILGNSLYFDKPLHTLHGYANNISDEIKFLITGMPLDRMMSNAGRNAFNTLKWLKMFGGIGAGLLGATVISQFFFGKLKTPERIKNDKLN